MRSESRCRCEDAAGPNPSAGMHARRIQHLDSGLAACRLPGMERWPRPRVPDGTSGGETAFPPPVRSELMVDTFTASKAAWNAAGRRTAQLTIHLRQNAPRRARYVCERSTKPARPPSGKHCNHLCAVCRLNLYVRLNAAMSRCPRLPGLNEFFAFFHRSSVSPKHLGRVNQQLGSYTCWAVRASRWGFEPLPREVERERFPRAYWRCLDFNLGHCVSNW